MFGREENTPNVTRRKHIQISCFCRSLQATESVRWIQKDQLCDGLVECSTFFVVEGADSRGGLVKLKAVITEEPCMSINALCTGIRMKFT